MHKTYQALAHLHEAHLLIEDSEMSKAVHNIYEELEQSTLANRPPESKHEPAPKADEKPAAKTTKKTASKKKASKKVAPKKKTVVELIDELPEGDMQLLPAPFALLLALPSDRRQQYITGIDISEYVTDKMISEAATRGADKSLTLEVISLAADARPDVVDAVVYEEWPDKWNNALSNALAAIGEHGDDLWNEIMSIYGVNKQTMQDLIDIAKAKRAGTV